MTTPTDDTIRASVAKSYGSRVTRILEGDALTLVAPAADACCGGDCCTTAAGDDLLGGVDDEIISNLARLYAEADVTGLPSTVTDVAFGCGNPTAIAALQPGEVVLDLGSGGGIDCFLAAKVVGPEGHVYGVDMTPEMIALARANAAKVGATNVEFRLGEIEQLPLADATVDVIISNCVVNLSPDKDRVFREAFRVLKPGGRLQVSDIVWTQEPPADIRHDMEQWAGCVAGALLESDYTGRIANAGFRDVTSTATEYPKGAGLASANVLAYKPA